MKYLILMFIFITGCNSENDEKPEAVKYINVGIDGYNLNGKDKVIYAGGDVDAINDNSWIFTSHTNELCVNNDKSRCNKADININDEYKNEQVKYSFEFVLVEYNLTDSPYYVIIWQDWRKRNPLDSNGRHPITTIKIKKFNDKIYLAHYDNSWQWGYDFGLDPEDTDHSLHQENTLNGAYEIEVGVDYDVEFYISPEGASLVVNGFKVSDKKYKTKSDIEEHKAQWGMYWDNDYNNENDLNKQIVTRMDNFARLVKQNL